MSQVKGILKKKKELEEPSQDSGIQWDEMNILMTEHPADKDYGHMKIEEPKTPYHELLSDEQDPSSSTMADISPDDIATRMLEASKDPKQDIWEREAESSEEEMPEEVKQHKKEFSHWRKNHYDEFHAMQKAKQLMKEEEEEEEEQQEEEEEEEEAMQ